MGFPGWLPTIISWLLSSFLLCKDFTQTTVVFFLSICCSPGIFMPSWHWLTIQRLFEGKDRGLWFTCATTLVEHLLCARYSPGITWQFWKQDPAPFLSELILFIFKNHSCWDCVCGGKTGMKSSGQLEVWRLKCVLSLKSPQLEEVAASVTGYKIKTPRPRPLKLGICWRQKVPVSLIIVFLTWNLSNCNKYLLASPKVHISVIATAELGSCLRKTLTRQRHSEPRGNHDKTCSSSWFFPSESCDFAVKSDVQRSPQAEPLLTNQVKLTAPPSGNFPAIGTVTTVLGGSVCLNRTFWVSIKSWLKSSYPHKKRKSAINQAKQLKCKMWTWLAGREKSNNQISSVSDSCKHLQVLSSVSWAAQLYELWNVHLYSFYPHRLFQVYEVEWTSHSAKWRCLFLSPIEIQQSCGIMTVHSNCSQTHTWTASTHIPEPPAHNPYSSRRNLGSGCGIEGPPFSRNFV